MIYNTLIKDALLIDKKGNIQLKKTTNRIEDFKKINTSKYKMIIYKKNVVQPREN